MARDVGAVVPAAGQGVRLGSRRPKALVPLAGKPLVLHALRALQETPAIGWIVLVAPPTEQARLRALVRHHRLTKVSAVVPGSAARVESVANGIAALPTQAKWVVIHDGARPCVTPHLLAMVVRYAKEAGAVACGLPASLTVKTVDATNTVRLTLDREHLRFIQTPQAFRRAWWREAMAHVDGNLARFPDDVSLLEWAGFSVRIVPGDPLNIKVTTQADLLLAETILRRR